jgi:hypothetical protein
MYNGKAVSVVCGKCSSPYATQLGLPDMTASTALKLGKNHRVQAAWNGAIQFEKALEGSLMDHSKKKDKRAFKDFSIAFANILRLHMLNSHNLYYVNIYAIVHITTGSRRRLPENRIGSSCHAHLGYFSEA